MNETEFSRIVEDTKKIVLAAVGRYLHPDLYEEIDDVVQETYIRAYRSIAAGKFKGESSPGTWLYVIARNESLRMNKKLKKISAASIESAGHLPDHRNSESRAETEEQLYEKVSMLPEKYRDVIELVLRGFSEAEIAAELKIKPGTVKSRSFRGREILQKLYREDNNVAFI